MKKYQDIVLDNAGNAVLSATITVSDNGGGVSTIYSDDGITAQANPFTASGVDGAYSFYAANGRYDINIVATGFTTENLTDIILYDVDDAPTSNAANVKWFGAVGDGVADDSTAFTNAQAAGNISCDPDDTYYLPDYVFADNSDVFPNGCTFLGGVVLGSNSTVQKAIFKSVEGDSRPLTLADSSNGASNLLLIDPTVYYTGQSNIQALIYAVDTACDNIKIVRPVCYMTDAVNTTTCNGIKIIGKSAARMTNIDIIDPLVYDIGRIGVEVQSDTTFGDQAALDAATVTLGYENINIVRGEVKDTGLKSGDSGQGISYTGFGQGSAKGTTIRRSGDISLETVDAVLSSFEDIDIFDPGSDPISASSPSSNYAYSNKYDDIRIHDANGHRVFMTFLDKPIITNHDWRLGNNFAIFRTIGGEFSSNHVITTGNRVLSLQGDGGLEVTRNILDNTANGSNSAVINTASGEDGAKIHHNTLLKGTGGVYVDATGANDIHHNNIYDDDPRFDQLWTHNYASDANEDLDSNAAARDMLRIRDTGVALTVGRTLKFPSNINVSMIMRNETLQTITVSYQTGAAVAIASSSTASVYGNVGNLYES